MGLKKIMEHLVLRRKATFTDSKFGQMVESEIASTLRVKCPYGGGEVLIVETSSWSGCEEYGDGNGKKVRQVLRR